MQAIILAGGLGTRLASVLSGSPKPMADINGKPFLELLLGFLARKGVQSVVLALGHKADFIKGHFGGDFRGIKILYSVENAPLGTGGALKKALQLCDKKDILVFNGDSFFELDLRDFCGRASENSKILLALKMMKDFDRYGRVELDAKGFIAGFAEKRHCEKGLINGGVYLVKKDIFGAFNGLGECFSFENFLQENFKTLNARGEIFEGYFKDIGVVGDYEQFKKDIKNNIISHNFVLNL